MSASLDSDLTIAFVDISCIVFPFDNFMGDGWLTAGGLMSCGLLGIGSDLCTICSPGKKAAHAALRRSTASRQRTPTKETQQDPCASPIVINAVASHKDNYSISREKN